MGSRAVRIFDIGREDGRNGAAAHISGTMAEVRQKETDFIDLVAYNHHIRRDRLSDDSRNTPPEARMVCAQEVIAHPLRGWKEVVAASSSPGYYSSELQNCEICNIKVNAPVPNRMYDHGGFLPIRMGIPYDLLRLGR